MCTRHHLDCGLIKTHGSELHGQAKWTSDTTVCYIHEQSILIECSLKAYHEKSPYEKTTRVTRTTSYYQLYKVIAKQKLTPFLQLGIFTTLLYSSPLHIHQGCGHSTKNF